MQGVVAEVSELIALRKYVCKRRAIPRSVARNGLQLSRWRGRGMDFAETRNYQAGDEIRHMEWRVTARTGRPHVKVFQEERERPSIILVDFSPSMYFGTRVAFKSVTAARLAAIVAWTASLQKDRVGGLLFAAESHHELAPKIGDRGVLPFLGTLSNYTKLNYPNFHEHQTQSRPIRQALLKLGYVVRPGSVVILISDAYSMDDESYSMLSRLRAHNDILFYHICDPIELAPPKPNRYPITDGSHELFFDVTSTTLAKAYQHDSEQRHRLLQEKLQQLHIQYVMVTASMDLPSLVHQTYPERINYG